MPSLNENECDHALINKPMLLKVARRIERDLKELDRLGVYLFAGSSITLRVADGISNHLVVAEVNGNAGGGDGATHIADDGFMRGE